MNAQTGSTDSIAQTDFMIIVVLVTSFIKLLFVTTLLIFHLIYIMRGLTTYVSNKYEELIAYHGNIYSGKSVKVNIFNRVIRKKSQKFDFRLLNNDNTFLVNECRYELSMSKPKIEGALGYSSMMNASEEDKLIKSNMVNNYIVINTNKLEINPSLVSQIQNSDFILSNSKPPIPISKMDTNNVVFTEEGVKLRKKNEQGDSLGSSNRRHLKHHTAKASKLSSKLGQKNNSNANQSKDKANKENKRYRNTAFDELLNIGANNSPYCKQNEVCSSNQNKDTFNIVNSEGNLFTRPKLKLK